MTKTLRDKSLVKVFKRYRERYLDSGKKPNSRKFLPSILYRTMKLEGEKITKKEARSLFR